MSSRMDKINKAKGVTPQAHVSCDNSALEMSRNSKHSYSVGASYEQNEQGEIFEERLAMWRNEY